MSLFGIAARCGCVIEVEVSYDWVDGELKVEEAEIMKVVCDFHARKELLKAAYELLSAVKVKPRNEARILVASDRLTTIIGPEYSGE